MWIKFRYASAASGLMLALVGATTITAIPTPAQIPPAPPLLETPTTTYQVPDQTRPAAPDQATPTTLYRVIVDSSNFVVLQQVQQVAGDAFVESFIDGRDRIQAGAFENEFGARQRVNDLASIGVRAVAYDTQGDAVYQALAPAQTSSPDISSPDIPGSWHTNTNSDNTPNNAFNNFGQSDTSPGCDYHATGLLYNCADRARSSWCYV